MIRFITLFLGILVGVHDVQVMVGGEVDAVELRLDGAVVARLEEEPWTAEVDFGDTLATQNLEAIAYDADGAEIDRTAQAINTPRPPAEVTMLIERDPDGRPEAVRLEWQSTDYELPSEVHVTLDGERLLEIEPHRFGLPRVDPAKFHLIQADLRFADGARAHAQTTFGGEYLAETGRELTAVLVSLSARKRAPAPEEMAGWFEVDGEPISVVAVEEGPVELLIVRSAAVASEMSRLDALGFRSTGVEGRRERALSLPDHYRLRLMEPRATRVSRGNLSFEAFLVSPSLTRKMGVYWALWQHFSIRSPTPQPRLSDAVATAALQAASGERRRAVILVTAGERPDYSTIEPTVAVSYLERLAVPLVAWQIGPAKAAAGWPEPHRIASYKDLRRAVRAVIKQVERQRVVWLDRRCDPRNVRLLEGRGIERIGSSG